jgi:hypothetical protein
MSSVWDVPDIVRHKHVASIEVAGSVHDAIVVGIGDVGTVRGSIIEALGPGVGGASGWPA